jgi:hypothetical protein
MTVDYQDVMTALAKCVDLSGNECQEDCTNCPYLSMGCDDPFMEYVVLPACLVQDIQTVLEEGASVWQTRYRSKRLS